MKLPVVAAPVAAALVLTANAISCSGQPTVRLSYGAFEGTSLPNSVDQFIGMRYAAPPLGDLRFRAPRPPEKHYDIQKAKSFGDYCIGTAEHRSQGISEDCLFVNVWRPSNSTPQAKLPVWVFIQGGGFNLNYSPNYNGSQVVAASGHNLVLVNFNWRVGLYGFFGGRNVEEHGDLNVGLLDQFGGDPNHVVIHGSSAGAGSVALHLLNQGNKKLFSGAIMESTFMPTQPHKSKLEWQYDRVIQTLGCSHDSSHQEMDCIRSKSTEDLQLANVASPFPAMSELYPPVWYWTPCIDERLILDNPLQMWRDGKFIRVPMIIGNNENEGAYFAINASTETDVTKFMESNYPQMSKKELHTMGHLYPRGEPVPQHAAWFPAAEKAYGEATFTCPAMGILDSAASIIDTRDTRYRELPLWSYHLNVYDKDYHERGLGCPHGYEEGMIFGPASTDTKLPGRYIPPASLNTYNAPLVPVIMNYWISFVRTLSPNAHKSSDALEWSTWKGKHIQSRLLIRLNGMKMEKTPRQQKERCEFWNKMDRALGPQS
ncbi:hypothetical protein NLG97_g1464 [Lecanicillium saksenae]|uniref:Uncharacterized protein n=1 Tax=Lecanicillium saksenae TaxID=468837 RepID=A0ACC1R4Y8_9HYPO|nr:hypothetical protein NLG97_g1464 [Lecanicillium saksenae]